jgi:hypothetical protein
VSEVFILSKKFQLFINMNTIFTKYFYDVCFQVWICCTKGVGARTVEGGAVMRYCSSAGILSPLKPRVLDETLGY